MTKCLLGIRKINTYHLWISFTQKRTHKKAKQSNFLAPAAKKKKNRKRRLSAKSETTNVVKLIDDKLSPRDNKKESQDDAEYLLMETSESDCSRKGVKISDVLSTAADGQTEIEIKGSEGEREVGCYIIPDTNIFIDDLEIIKKLKDLEDFLGLGPPFIFISWVVVGELDRIKERKNNKAQPFAIKAVQYINSVITKNSRFVAEDPLECEAALNFPSFERCNDNKILKTCLTLAKKKPHKEVILVTNDRNMCNKAMMLKLKVFNFEQIIKKIGPNFINYVETPCIEMSEEEIVKDACLESPENESSIKDVEMRDVSEDILDDLSEKKETLFDTTAMTLQPKTAGSDIQKCSCFILSQK